MFSKGKVRPMCHLQSFLQCYSPYVLSLYNLLIAALLCGGLGPGQVLKEEGWVFQTRKHLWGLASRRPAPCCPCWGTADTQQGQVSQIPPFTLEFSTLCFEVLAFKSSSRKGTCEGQIAVLLSILIAQSTFLRRLCGGRVRPRDGMHC